MDDIGKNDPGLVLIYVKDTLLHVRLYGTSRVLTTNMLIAYSTIKIVRIIIKIYEIIIII